MVFVLNRQKANPTLTRGPNVHQIKAHRLKKHASNNAPYPTGARPLASGTVHVSFNDLLMRHRISRRRLFSHTPIWHSFTPRYDSLFSYFSRIPSNFPHWLVLRSANVPADTFRPTAKTYRHRTGELSATVASINFSPNISLVYQLSCPYVLNSLNSLQTNYWVDNENMFIFIWSCFVYQIGDFRNQSQSSFLGRVMLLTLQTSFCSL